MGWKIKKDKIVNLGSGNCWCEVGIWGLKVHIVKENNKSINIWRYEICYGLELHLKKRDCDVGKLV